MVGGDVDYWQARKFPSIETLKHYKGTCLEEVCPAKMIEGHHYLMFLLVLLRTTAKQCHQQGTHLFFEI